MSEASASQGDDALQHFLDDGVQQAEPDARMSPRPAAPDKSQPGLGTMHAPLVPPVDSAVPPRARRVNSEAPVSKKQEAHGSAQEQLDAEGAAEGAQPSCTEAPSAPFCSLRVVQVEAMEVQVRLLVRMCRWRHALDSIEQLRVSLAALQLHEHSSLQECEMLEGMCLAGLARYDEAEKKLRSLAQELLQARLEQGAGSEASQAFQGSDARAVGGGAWSHAQQRVRYFQCVKAAGSIREIRQDFVAASADYVESAQSWALSHDLASQQHPFVAEASFCTTRARMRGGLLSDMQPWHQQLVQLTVALGLEHPAVSSAQLDVSEALLARGALEEAETLLLQARTALLASCGQAHASSARCLFLLALVYEQRGPGGRNYKSVIKMLDAALLVFLRSPLLLSLSLSQPHLLPHCIERCVEHCREPAYP